MPKVEVINERGARIEQEITSRNVAVIPDAGTSFKPAVAQEVEYDHTGDMSAVTTVCGETENRRESDDKPDMTISGVITEDQLDPLKTLNEGDEIELVSDIHNGMVIVGRVTITQSADLIHFIPDGGEKQLAFSFQLQLKEPE